MKKFIHECVFSHNLNYKCLKDNLYIVNMTSGRSAVYSMESSGYYGGTGQKDFEFTFVRYLNDKANTTH